MKIVLIFLAGAFVGVVLLIMVSFVISHSSAHHTPSDEITMLPEVGECVSSNSFEVIKVLDTGDALAVEQEKLYKDVYSSTDLTVLLLSKEGEHFYDHQIIKATKKGYCFKQIGIYKYTSRYGDKTVPIVAVMGE